jgi:hypothetical protein
MLRSTPGPQTTSNRRIAFRATRSVAYRCARTEPGGLHGLGAGACVTRLFESGVERDLDSPKATEPEVGGQLSQGVKVGGCGRAVEFPRLDPQIAVLAGRNPARREDSRPERVQSPLDRPEVGRGDGAVFRVRPVPRGCVLTSRGLAGFETRGVAARVRFREVAAAGRVGAGSGAATGAGDSTGAGASKVGVAWAGRSAGFQVRLRGWYGRRQPSSSDSKRAR